MPDTGIRAVASTSDALPQLDADPGEGFQATNLQLFGADPVVSSAQPANAGFVTNFQRAITYDLSNPYSDSLPSAQPSDIMGMFTPVMLPILSGLARGFAVCDRWFASVPTEAMPNRAFACAGMSLGHRVKYFNTPAFRRALRRPVGLGCLRRIHPNIFATVRLPRKPITRRAAIKALAQRKHHERKS
ncbi:MAG: alkaline phosphatase family protein [Aliidongia sp.]